MRLIVAIVALLSCTAAAAQVKPGLWEMTMKSDQFKQQPMPNLTPAQKEQMQKMGVTLPTVRDGAFVQQVCLTKEDIARNKTPGAPREASGECKIANQNQSGNTYRADLVCDGPNLKGKGTLKGTYSGDSSYTSSYDFNGTSRGREANQHIETSGKWLKADCGSVKPASELAEGLRKK
jgi:hypothetical protein